MNDKKMILFCDIDDTLVDSEKNCSAENIKAIRRLSEAGHHFVICSGRPLRSCLALTDRLGITDAIRYFIAHSGGAVYDRANDTYLFRETLTIRDTSRLFARAESLGLYIQAYDRAENVLTRRPCRESMIYADRTKLDVIYDETLPSSMEEAPPKCVAINFDSPDKLRRMKELSEEEDPHLCYIFSCPEYLECLPSAASKGSAAAFLCDRLGIRIEDCFACGDEENDLSMLLKVGHPFAVANAVPALKDRFRNTKATAHDGAVAEVIDTMLK